MKDREKTRAVVVLSGGQDSATCAAWALTAFDEVEAITFDYVQRHRREIESAKKIAALLKMKHTITGLPVLMGQPTSGLTDHLLDVSTVSAETGLPRSFVPGRNLVMLTSASAFALARGYRNLVTGVCQTDFSGYPDCRRDTIDALERAIILGNRGLTSTFRILTPLMDRTKADTVKFAQRLPKGMDAVALSWTCYEGREKPCRKCPACVLRAKGFKEAGVEDPAL